MNFRHPDYLLLSEAFSEYGEEVLKPMLAAGSVKAKFRRNGKFTSATDASMFLDSSGTATGDIYIWKREVRAALALAQRIDRPKPKLLVDNVARLPDGRRKPGPKPSVTSRVRAEMEKFDLETLNEMGEEEMVAHFHASRDTCRKARKELLNSDK